MCVCVCFGSSPSTSSMVSWQWTPGELEMGT